MIITIASFPGTETKNIGKLLALQIGLRYVSEDDLMKRIAVEENVSIDALGEMDSDKFVKRTSEIIQAEAKRNGAIIDHLCAAWILNEADVKMFLHSMKKNRARKIVERERIPVTEALQKIENQEREKSSIFLNNFGVDLRDLSIYDLVINIDKLDEDGIVAVVRKYLEKV